VKICVFGAGAVGGHLAVRLARGGAEVSVVARGANLAAIRARGLTVHAADGIFEARPAASDDPAAFGVQDAVLVTTKAPALPSVAAAIAPLLGPQTPVVFVLNGIPWWYFFTHGGEHDGRRLPEIDPDDALFRSVGPARTVGGVVYSACDIVEPGVIHVGNPRSRLVIGEIDGMLSARAAAVGAVLDAGGMTGEVTSRIRDTVWLKLLMNLSTGPMAVLTLSPSKVLFTEPACVAAAQAVAAEVAAVAHAFGCPVDPARETRIAPGSGITHKPSILQDLEAGRPMEVAAMFEAPRVLARLAGVATPTLDLLASLAVLRARAPIPARGT
jgi:2-dehydropantoate 2-reductase